MLQTELISVCVLFVVVSILCYSLILEMEAIWFSETSGCLRTTPSYNTKDAPFHSYSVMSIIALVFIIFLFLILIQDHWCIRCPVSFWAIFRNKPILGIQKYSSMIAIMQVKLRVASLLLYSSFLTLVNDFL